jgi:DNA mismatch repair protein MutS
MGLYTDYLKLQQQSEEKYGERTVVLYQVGSFYEVYSFNVDYCNNAEARTDELGHEWTNSVGDAEEISKILNCACNNKNHSKPHALTNPKTCGFPIGAYEKNLTTLLLNDFVVVRVDQVGDTTVSKRKVDREIADVSSPTMNADIIAQDVVTCNIMAVYIEYSAAKINIGTSSTVSIGVAVVDSLTCKNKVCEFYSKSVDPLICFQQLYHFILAHKPRELLLNLINVPEGSDKEYINFIDKELELERYNRVIRRVNDVSKEYSRVAYQTECLNVLFLTGNKSRDTLTNTKANKKGVGSKKVIIRDPNIISTLGLEMMSYGRIAYILLMERCKAHNPDILEKIDPPDTCWIDESNRLILTHNSLIQLDIVTNETTGSGKKGRAIKLKKENSKITSLISLLDQNATNLGKRLMYSLIQSPLVKQVEIENYYNMVDECLHTMIDGDVLWKILGGKLSELPDMDRLSRKLQTKRITPSELVTLMGAYRKVKHIFGIINRSTATILASNLLSVDDTARFAAMLKTVNESINMDGMITCTLTKTDAGTKAMEFEGNPFRRKTHPEICEQFDSLEQDEARLKKIIEHLNSNFNKGGVKIITGGSSYGNKKRSTAQYDMKITATNAKAKTLLAAKVSKSLCGKISAETHTAAEKVISSDIIDELLTAIVKTKKNLRKKLLVAYDALLDKLTCVAVDITGNAIISTGGWLYSCVNNVIARIDVAHNYAKLAHKYDYYRPKITILPECSGKIVSHIDAKNLRHPISERIIDGAYITNDVQINQNGMLIFGHNRVGKSSLIKAVALLIVMAQAGCYVSAEMEYSPYYKIFTRLSNNDDLLASKSSFDVEMCELRTILRQADAGSLVLGNELGCSTEMVSGMALSGSALESLVEIKCGFLMASHLHNLTSLPTISAIPGTILRICHLAVVRDLVTNMLIYNRKLTDGLGSRIYGVHVAESLGLEPRFIERAYKIVDYIHGEGTHLVNPVRSKYNNSVYMNKCMLCDSSSNLDTHHIIPQKDVTSSNKLVNGMHIHSADNLIVLCKQCHNTTHSIDIKYTVLDTPQGKVTYCS